MKVRNINLLVIFAALVTLGVQAAENPFAPENHPLSSIQTETPSSPFAKESEEPANPFAPTSPAIVENNSAITALPSPEEPANPFAPENHPTDPHVMEPEHHEQAEHENHLGDHAAVATKEENPFLQEKNALPKDHPAMAEHHEALTPTPSIHQGHMSTAQHTASIKTVHITPGHSAALEPITITKGIEAERYFIQDKKYESYLSSHVDPTKRTYSVTIPASVHVGSFTVFKVQGMHGTPDHLEPAYHVEIQGNMHEIGTGTQYPEPQGSAIEKLTQLEDKYLTGIQTQFKAFTQEVRELISTAHQNGESLEAAKLHATHIVATKEPLKLIIGESHIATSFTGGSAQSSNPAIVSAILKFDGTKTDPKWKLVLAAHKAGEAIITYSSGSESNLQPVIVVEKSSIQTSPEHKEEAPITLKDSTTAPAKKETRAFSAPNDADEEESEEKNYKKSEITTSTSKEEESEEEDSEETDEKKAEKMANEDEPFSSFLKEAPEEEAASNDEESSDPSATESESIESATQAKATTDADDTDEEPTQDQEEDK